MNETFLMYIRPANWAKYYNDVQPNFWGSNSDWALHICSGRSSSSSYLFARNSTRNLKLGFGEGVRQGVLGTVVSQWDPGAKSLVGVKGQSTSKMGVCGRSPQKLSSFSYLVVNLAASSASIFAHAHCRIKGAAAEEREHLFSTCKHINNIQYNMFIMQWWVVRRARAHQSWPPIAPNNITIHSNNNKKIKKWCNVRMQNQFTN